MRGVVILLFLFSSTAFAQEEKKEFEDPTGKVFTSLADYTVNRDKVMNKCAFFAVAEIHTLRKGDEPDVRQHIWTALFDHNRLLTYRANGNWSIPDRPWMQIWQEWLEHAGQTKSRVRMWNTGNSEYFIQKVGEKQLDFMQKSSGSFSFVDPFDDIFRANAVTHIFQIKNYVEKYFMENGELKSSVLIGGVLKTKWRCYGNSDLTMDQSQAQGFMPTEIQYSDTRSDQTIHIEWKEQDDLWVPTHIRSSETHKGGLWTKSSFAKFDWRLGKDAKTINPKSPDILPEFMEQFAPFKLDHADENGSFVRGTEFVAPPDLFTDLDDTKKK